MFATAFCPSKSFATLSIRMEIVTLSVAITVLLAMLWLALNPRGRSKLAAVFFYHHDSARRRSEIRMLGLAMGLGFIFAILIAAGIYVLNVTHRL